MKILFYQDIEDGSDEEAGLISVIGGHDQSSLIARFTSGVYALVTNFILAESGDSLITEAGDNLILE